MPEHTHGPAGSTQSALGTILSVHMSKEPVGWGCVWGGSGKDWGLEGKIRPEIKGGAGGGESEWNRGQVFVLAKSRHFSDMRVKEVLEIF